MKRRIISLIMCVLLLLTIIIPMGCGGQKGRKDDIVVGVILPLTGTFSGLGQEYKKIIELAISNSNSKKDIKFIFEDGAGNVKNSIMAYNKLNMTEKPDIIISIVSNVCLALKPLIEKNEQIFFAEAADPRITENNNGYIFRHSQTSVQEGDIISDYLKEHNKRILVIAPSDDYYYSLVEELKNNGIVDDIEYYNKGEYKKNISKLIAKRTTHNNQSLFIGGYGAELAQIIKEARSFKYDGEIYTSLSSFVVPGVKGMAGDAFYEIYAPYFCFDEADSNYLKIQMQYQELYQKEIPVYLLLEYNTIKLLYDSINRMETYSNENLKKILLKLDYYNGVGENMKIEKNGDINPELKMMEL